MYFSELDQAIVRPYVIEFFSWGDKVVIEVQEQEVSLPLALLAIAVHVYRLQGWNINREMPDWECPSRVTCDKTHTKFKFRPFRLSRITSRPNLHLPSSVYLLISF
jgi:hypothetical protein